MEPGPTRPEDADGPPIDPLRLSFCPGCGYALGGLAAAGLCPECGAGYDAAGAAVVLRAHHPLSSGGPWLARQLALSAAAAAVVVLLLRRFGGALSAMGVHPVLILAEAGGALLVLVATRLYVRLAVPWPNPFLLWVTPAGVAARSTVSPGSVTARVRVVPGVAVYLGALLLAYCMSAALLHSRRAAVAVTLAVPLVTLASTSVLLWAATGRFPRPVQAARRVARRWRLTRAAPVAGPPPLVPWAAVTHLHVRPGRNGRHRFFAGCRRWRWTVPLVRLDVDLSPAGATALLDRIARWRRP